MKEKVQNCTELISNSCKFGDKSTKTGNLDSLMVALLLMEANITHNMDVNCQVTELVIENANVSK